MKIVKIACDLDEASFMSVEAVVRWTPPLSKRVIIYGALLIYSYLTLEIPIDPLGSYIMCG